MDRRGAPPVLEGSACVAAPQSDPNRKRCGMKRSLLLVVAVSLAFVACQKKNETNEEVTPAVETTPAAAPAPAMADTTNTAATTTPAAEPAPATTTSGQ